MSLEQLYLRKIKEFGILIRKKRKEKGISQLDLEMKSGINRTEISRIERGKKNIEFFTLVRLIDSLDCDFQIEIINKKK